MKKALLMILTIGLVTACESEHHPSVQAELERAEHDTPVVTTIDGRSIDAAEFRAFWRRHPDMTRAQALEALQQRELLVAHAIEQELGQLPAAQHARKTAMVRTLLSDAVETAVGEDDLDKEVLESAMEQTRARLRTPAGYRVHAAVLYVPEKRATEMEEAQLEMIMDGARAASDGLIERLGPRPDLATFQAAIEQTKIAPPAAVRFTGEMLIPSTDEDYSALPPEWRPADIFANAVASLEEGQLSEPVRYTSAWYVLRLDETIEAGEPSENEVRERTLAALLTEKRREKLVELMAPWLEEAEWTLYPEVIRERHEDSK